MKILLYGLNYYPELTGIGKYTGELGPWFLRKGHTLHVVTAPPYYPDWNTAAGYSCWLYKREQIEAVKICRCPLYVPSQPTSIKRLLHLLSFSVSSLPIMLRYLFWKPDVIVLIVPTMFCSLTTLLVARLISAKCVLHIQDYEVDALFGLSNSASAGKRLAYSIESWLLSRFDRVSTISKGMLNRALEKGVSPAKLIYFPNWSELKRFDNVIRNPPLLESLGVPDGKKLVLYSGNLGDKQGVEDIVEAAHLLAHDKQIFFLIIGEGAGKTLIFDKVQYLQLRNITFAELQPNDILPQLLASADCHLVVQKRGVADAVLPSKLTNILAVGGNSVITAEKQTTLGQLCEEHPGIAICVEPESPEALVKGILQALNLASPNQVAKKYAHKYLDKEEILSAFEEELIKLVDNN